MKILTLFFLIAGCCLPRLCSSQTTNEYIYGYDESGNRKLREKVISFKSAQLPKDSLSKALAEAKKQDVFEEMFENKQITIYPNPTKGMVTVEISLTEQDNARIAVYDIRGSLLIEYKNVSSRTNIDLTNELPGTYLMKIFIGKIPTTWKIIKQD